MTQMGGAGHQYANDGGGSGSGGSGSGGGPWELSTTSLVKRMLSTYISDFSFWCDDNAGGLVSNYSISGTFVNPSPNPPPRGGGRTSIRLNGDGAIWIAQQYIDYRVVLQPRYGQWALYWRGCLTLPVNAEMFFGALLPVSGGAIIGPNDGASNDYVALGVFNDSESHSKLIIRTKASGVVTSTDTGVRVPIDYTDFSVGLVNDGSGSLIALLNDAPVYESQDFRGVPESGECVYRVAARCNGAPGTPFDTSNDFMAIAAGRR